MIKNNLEELVNRNLVYYKIYVLGEFVILDKLVFLKYEKWIINIDEIRYLLFYFGLDFGYINDLSVLIYLKIDIENKKFYIILEYVKKGMLNDEIVKFIKNLGFSKEVLSVDLVE